MRDLRHARQRWSPLDRAYLLVLGGYLIVLLALCWCALHAGPATVVIVK
jgi:hypothetical protein